MIKAVIDTNVMVSALLAAKDSNSNPLAIMEAIRDGKVIPLYSEDILAEYEEVLLRPKFNLNEDTVYALLRSIQDVGIYSCGQSEYRAAHEDDHFFLDALQPHLPEAFLITGNLKHYPQASFIISPKQAVEMLIV